MKILATGGKGQLGRAIVRRGKARGVEVHSFDLDELDVTDPAQIAAQLAAVTPDIVINAAAYTAVDKAESERERAFAVNATAAGYLAEACAARNVRLLHVSTDYVFDGTATRPYREDDPIGPTSVYGASKAAGEQLVHAARGTVVRTSWLFEEAGPSFVHTMLRLAKDREVLRVVADQQGCPTWADDLADGLIDLATVPALAATYHYCNAGPTTWHGFASTIIEIARTLRPLACTRVDAITTAEYPTPARRPAYSILDTSRITAHGIVPPSWHAGVRHVIEKVLQ